ncbi:KH domain-containing protein [candidate division KSB1 bacterium]|nr:KH domain-containing protein [candidate division KSB1 bacterium]
MKEFIEYIIKELVDKPDEVHINEIDGEKSSVFELRVGKGDFGKVIGKHGKTARSIRILAAAVSAKLGRRTIIEILE